MARARVSPPVSEPAKSQWLAAHADGAHGALGRVVVDGHAAVLEEEREGRPALEGVAEGLREVALAGEAGELGFRPGAERFDLGRAVGGPRGKALGGAAPGDLALEVVEGSDAVEGVAGDGGLGGGPNVVEGAAQMRPAGGLAELAGAVGARLVELAEARCRRRPAGRRRCRRDGVAGARPSGPARSGRRRRAARAPPTAVGRARRPRCAPA